MSPDQKHPLRHSIEERKRLALPVTQVLGISSDMSHSSVLLYLALASISCPVPCQYSDQLVNCGRDLCVFQMPSHAPPSYEACQVHLVVATAVVVQGPLLLCIYL